MKPLKCIALMIRQFVLHSFVSLNDQHDYSAARQKSAEIKIHNLCHIEMKILRGVLQLSLLTWDKS